MQIKRKSPWGHEGEALALNWSGQVAYLAFPSLDALGMAVKRSGMPCKAFAGP